MSGGESGLATKVSQIFAAVLLDNSNEMAEEWPFFAVVTVAWVTTTFATFDAALTPVAPRATISVSVSAKLSLFRTLGFYTWESHQLWRQRTAGGDQVPARCVDV